MASPGAQAVDTDRAAAVLQGLLYVLGKGVYRTKLVKLTYLLDESSYRLRGQTMTGLNYIWDHYGPNAADNAIVCRLDDLAEAGKVSMSARQVGNGPVAYSYQLAQDFDPSALPLSGDDWSQIHSLVHKYGAMNRAQIVRESKATAPFLNAQQYEQLEFKQAPTLTTEEVSADPFWQETLAAMRDNSERVTLEELREEVAQSSQL